MNNLPVYNEINSKEKQKAFDNINDIIQNKIEKTQNIEDFYSLVQELSNNVNLIYNDIKCQKGCSYCCKFYGSPQLYDFEWEYIKNHIEKNFSENEIKRVYNKFKSEISNLKSQLEKESEKIDLGQSFSVSLFYISECPFLYKNQCSIYSKRPLICRIFGNSYSSTIKKEEGEPSKNIVSCVEEKERWKNDIIDSNIKPDNILLDHHYITNLLEKKFGKNSIINTMQYWLTEYFNEY